jgi:hypothetical protein
MVLPIPRGHAGCSRRRPSGRDSLVVQFARHTEEGDPMRRSARWFRIPLMTLVLAAVFLALIPALVAASPRPAEACQNIGGTVELSATPIIVEDELVGFDAVATTITGHLEGSMTAVVEITSTSPGGVIHFGGVHFFSGSQFGDFQTIDRGLVAPSGRVNNDLTIVDGASGFIKAHGTVDLSTLTIHAWYHGRVCT